jgi:alpha-1,2-mannosyltransferase
VVLVVLGSVNLVVSGRAGRAMHWWAVDFDINMVAARRLVDGQPLYDAAAARREGARLYGSAMLRTGRGLFSSFIGPPTTALAHVPFLAFSSGTALALFRLLAALGMVGAVVLAACSLERPARVPAALVGVGVLLVGFPFVKTLVLGQANELVMLAIALGMWGATRGHWRVVGVGFGIATLLKVSPGLFLIYLAVRGYRAVIAPAVATMAAWLSIAAVVGRPGDALVWSRDIGPALSKGTVGVYNQSLPAWLARIATAHPDLGVNVSLGAWSLIASAFGAGALVVLWRVRRGRRIEPLEIGLLVLVAVLMGPLSWDHYATWAVIGLVPLIDVEHIARLPRRQLLTAGALITSTLVLVHQAIQIPDPGSGWSMRVTSGPYTLAVAVWLGLDAWMLLWHHAPNDTVQRPLAEPTPASPGTGAEPLETHGPFAQQ